MGVDWSCAELGTLLKEAKKKKELYIKSDYLTDSWIVAIDDKLWKILELMYLKFVNAKHS